MSIVEKVKAIATKQAENTEFSLYDVEYVKEGTEYFLRIYFDKDGGLTLDDCVLLSEKLAEELDKEDFISDKYYLEVSSPGIERDLRDLEEVTNSVGKHVYIKTYEKIDNQKEFYGDILAVETAHAVIVAFATLENFIFQTLQLPHQLLIGGIGFQLRKRLCHGHHLLGIVSLSHFKLRDLLVLQIAGCNFDNLPAELLAFFQTGLQIGKPFTNALHTALQGVVNLNQPTDGNGNNN